MDSQSNRSEGDFEFFVNQNQKKRGKIFWRLFKNF